MKSYSTITCIIFLFLAVLFASCSITGRRYMSGYHVEWKHPASYTITGCKSNVKINSNPIPFIAVAPVLQVAPVKQIEYSSLTAITQSTEHKKNKNRYSPVAALVKDIKTITSHHQEERAQGNDSKANLSIVLGVCSMMLPFIFIALGIVVLNGSGVYSAFVAYIGITLITWFLCALIGFIEGVIVLNNPDEYGGKGDATAGVVLNAIALGVASLLIVIGLSVVF